MSCNTGAAFNAIRWQQVMVIKCFFISSQATTMVQNRIKQSGGTLPLLMLRPFENVLATRRATSLQAGITEQSDGAIGNEVWELSSTLLTFKHLRCFPYHHYVLVATASPHSPCVMSTLCVTRQVSADWRATAADALILRAKTFIQVGVQMRYYVQARWKGINIK